MPLSTTAQFTSKWAECLRKDQNLCSGGQDCQCGDSVCRSITLGTGKCGSTLQGSCGSRSFLATWQQRPSGCPRFIGTGPGTQRAPKRGRAHRFQYGPEGEGVRLKRGLSGNRRLLREPPRNVRGVSKGLSRVFHRPLHQRSQRSLVRALPAQCPSLAHLRTNRAFISCCY